MQASTSDDTPEADLIFHFRRWALIAKSTKPNCADQVEAAERVAQGECLTL
jgi:hypothetical protein